MSLNRLFLYLIIAVIIGVGYFLINPSVDVSSDEMSDHSTVLSKQDNPTALNMTKEPSRTLAQVNKVGPAAGPMMEADLIKKLRFLENCYKKEGLCGFQQDDPKAEFFAIGKEIAETLLLLEHKYHGDYSRSSELNEIARHYLSNPDGHVKKAALHLMTSQEPDMKNLDSILKEVIAYHDANLIEIAMLELTRYLGHGSDQKIHRTLATVLVTGAPFVSVEIAKRLSPFINEQSFETYRRSVNQLRNGSQTQLSLKVALEEYDRRQSAG